MSTNVALSGGKVGGLGTFEFISTAEVPSLQYSDPLIRNVYITVLIDLVIWYGANLSKCVTHLTSFSKL